MQQCHQTFRSRLFSALLLRRVPRTFSTSSRSRSNDEHQRRSTLPNALTPLGFKYMEPATLRARFDAYDTTSSNTLDSSEVVQLLKDAGAADTTEIAAQAAVQSMDISSTGKKRQMQMLFMSIVWDSTHYA